MKLTDQVAIVTGGGRGIGEAIVKTLAGAGAKVAVFDILRQDAIRVTQEVKGLGGEAIGLEADVTDEGQIDACLRKVLKRYGKVDILVNNAGLLILHGGKKAWIWEMELEEWDKMLAVNLRGVFICSKAVLREMIKRTGSEKRIINLSSGAAKLGGMISSSAYVAAKAGVIGFTKITAREAAPYGITVNCVAPGMIDAPMMRLSTPPEKDAEAVKAVPLGRLGTVQDIAEAVLFLSSKESSYITGATIDVNGGWVMY
jgi:NAD(P)-dependent dehydrogenase (short-subunit alcohol dehydrogenase family)